MNGGKVRGIDGNYTKREKEIEEEKAVRKRKEARDRRWREVKNQRKET